MVIVFMVFALRPHRIVSLLAKRVRCGVETNCHMRRDTLVLCLARRRLLIRFRAPVVDLQPSEKFHARRRPSIRNNITTAAMAKIKKKGKRILTERIRFLTNNGDQALRATRVIL